LIEVYNDTETPTTSSFLNCFSLHSTNKAFTHQKLASVYLTKTFSKTSFCSFTHFPITRINMSGDKAPSTLQSYVDSATGAVQSAIGSLTGNTGDQVKGDAKKDAAKVEHDASQASVKVPGATISSDGGVNKDHPDRSAGNWNQTVGSAKETIGGLVGSEVS
jgi:uncharacterized protein YjbJ (UPF0337 family)